ncbi:MAG: ATP-binding protein [Aphanothece sp. CMT-3BRIN-NPC111]|jgi:hypothetical protein|nr:ATP-binding protein [Aphanothece sp. CMT-3BRIN-NPC111]
MSISSNSSIEELNAAIQTHNPFLDRGAAVRIQDVWEPEFFDIPTLNAHASDAIFQTIRQLSSSQAKVTSIAITGEQGIGKTHLISRIRHLLLNEDNALFIYASASNFSELNLIQYQFLQILSHSLNQIGSQGISQWQELAVDILIEAYTSVNKLGQVEKIIQSPKDIVANQFTYVIEKNNSFIDSLTSVISKSKPNIDPDIIRAILLTLSENHAAYAIKWLSGNDLSEAKAAELRLPNHSQEEREAQAFDFVLQILSLIDEYRPLLVCFDELEGVTLNNAGATKAQVVAELVKNLFDSLTLSSRSHGVIILTVMLPDTWKLQINTLPGGLPYRVSAATKDPIELKYIDGDSIVELVTVLLNNFYETLNLVPPDPVYPFTESQLKKLGKQKTTIRQVLQWCAEHFKVPDATINVHEAKDDLNLVEAHPVEALFNKELTTVEESLGNLLQDKPTVAAALLLCFFTVIGKTLDQLEVERIDKVEPQGANKGYIDFKILGKEDEQTVKIGVAVTPSSNGIEFANGLKRLIDYQKFDLTRGCLVSSPEINFADIQAEENLTQLLSPPLSGKLVPLEAEHIKPLLAILSIYSARKDYGLSKEEIFDFVDQKKLVVENELILEIVKPASAQFSNDLVNNVEL